MTPGKPNAPPVARLIDVRVHYGKAVALDGVVLDIPAGCMVGLIGPDGVGKSTLSTHIAGYFASRGLSVTLGDIDRQQSSRLWLSLRPPN